jgi:hypothetical protein
MQQAKQQAGAAAAEEEGMPELTLKQALVGAQFLLYIQASCSSWCRREHVVQELQQLQR